MNVNQIQSSIYGPVKEIDLILSNLILTNNEVKELDEINKKKKRIKKAEIVFLKIEKRWVAELKHKEKELPILKIDQVEMANRLNLINNAFINKLNKFYDNLKYSIIKRVQKDVLWSIIEEMMKELEMQKKKNDKGLKIALPELDIQEKVQKERRINLDKLVDDKKKKEEYDVLIHAGIIQEADIRKIRVERLHKLLLSHSKIIFKIQVLKYIFKGLESAIKNSKKKI